MTPSLTSEGHVLLLRALDGEALKFTRIQLGNGVAQNAKNATSLSNPLISMLLTKMTTGSQYITLTSSFSNSKITAGFRITEVGIWAEDPDDEGSEILYALGNEPEGTADYIPSKDSRILEHRDEVGHDDGLGKKIFVCAKQVRALPFPYISVGIIIPSVRGP